MTVWPSPRSASARAAASPASTPSVVKQRRVADRDACGRRPRPRTPLPVIDSKARRRAERDAALARAPRDDRGGQRMLAAPLEAGRQAQQRRPRRRRRPASTVDQRRLALGQRAGLVDDQRVDLLAAPRAPRRSGTARPRSAPRPVPTMIDIGVARPSAHGQAMISTATALTSACASRGSGPDSRPDGERDDGDRDHGRHEPAGDAVGQPLDRRPRRAAPRRPCGRSARAACRRRRARAASRSAPVPLTVPPVTALARRLLDRDRLAGDHRLVDGARCPRARRRRPGSFSPGRTRSRSPTCTCVERHVLLARRRRRRAAPSCGASPSSARIAALGPAARAQLQHLAEQHQRRRSPPPPRSRRRPVAVRRGTTPGTGPGASVATTL